MSDKTPRMVVEEAVDQAFDQIKLKFNITSLQRSIEKKTNTRIGASYVDDYITSAVLARIKDRLTIRPIAIRHDYHNFEERVVVINTTKS